MAADAAATQGPQEPVHATNRGRTRYYDSPTTPRARAAGGKACLCGHQGRRFLTDGDGKYQNSMNLSRIGRLIGLSSSRQAQKALISQGEATKGVASHQGGSREGHEIASGPLKGHSDNQGPQEEMRVHNRSVISASTLEHP
jgi:hypothetical protein